MNKRLLFIGLLCLMFLHPTFGLQTVTINLNGMAYTPETPVMIQEQTPYVALDELENLVLASITRKSPTRYDIKIGKDTYELFVGGKQLKTPGRSIILSEPILSFDNKPYVPITILLEAIGYPHTWDTSTGELSLTAIAPYSMNTNDPKGHKFIPSRDNLRDYPKHLIAFSSEEAIAQKVALSQRSNSYLAFVDSTHVNEVISLTKDKIKTSPYNHMNLMVRQVGFQGDQAVLKGFKTYPITLTPGTTDLTISIGNQSVKCSNYWSAFYPGESLVEMDLDASLDATLMRHFYYYFRDQNDLRDDKFFKSTLTLSDLRTTTLRQPVYTQSTSGETTEYEVVIYRIHPSGAVYYIVDLIQKDA
ncbi:MAG: stalk domain-containing protein [Cellulosilyticaceae bacterium]